MTKLQRLTIPALHEFYTKAVLPQFGLIIDAPSWYETRKLGPDEMAHTFTFDHQTYILIYEDYYELGRSPHYIFENLGLDKKEFEYISPTSHSEHSPSYRGFTLETPYKFVEGVTGSFTLIKILKR